MVWTGSVESKRVENSDLLAALSASKNLDLIRNENCPAGCFMSRFEVEHVGESWAQRCPSRNVLANLRKHIGELGGAIRANEGSQMMLLVAESVRVFAITRDDLWGISQSLGHMALHFSHIEIDVHDPSKNILAVPSYIPVNSPLSRARSEAAWFASAFLMPRNDIAILYHRCGGSLNETASALGLPKGMVAARLERLSLH